MKKRDGRDIFIVTVMFLMVTMMFFVVTMVLLVVTMVFLVVTMVFLVVPMVFLVVTMRFLFMFLVDGLERAFFIGLMVNNTLRRMSMTVIMAVVVIVLCNYCCHCDSNQKYLFDDKKNLDTCYSNYKYCNDEYCSLRILLLLIAP